MEATSIQWTRDDVARVGTELLARIEPTLPPDHVGRFIAVDVKSGEYEVDEDDYTAVHRLHARVPAAEVWLSMVGEEAAYRMGLR